MPPCAASYQPASSPAATAVEPKPVLLLGPMSALPTQPEIEKMKVPTACAGFYLTFVSSWIMLFKPGAHMKFIWLILPFQPQTKIAQ